MTMKTMTLAAMAMILAAAPATADRLSTGSGDGKVTLETSGTGAMAGTGTYDPVGAQGAASTIYASDVFYRIGDTGRRNSFSTGAVQSFAGDDTSRTSVFTLPDLSVALRQSVAGLFSNGTPTGSLLTQTYTITNLLGSAIELDLVRYLDGDLNYSGGLNDGGGILMSEGAPLLFETDDPAGSETMSTFVGIYNRGGVANGYQILPYSSLAAALANGAALDNTIAGDADGDGFIDGAYDVTLGIGNRLSIGANGTATFSTYTLFGTGTPSSVVAAVPEPASWAMMLSGFGLVGGALRRRRREAERALAAA